MKGKNPQTPKKIEDFALRKLGAILRRERERRGLTQLEIGKRMGKSKIAIHFYETAKRPIHWGTFVKLCSALRTSPAFIIDRWMRSDVFDVLDEERKREYRETLEEAFRYNLTLELDSFMVYFRGLIEREKEIKRRLTIKREFDQYYPKQKREE